MKHVKAQFQPRWRPGPLQLALLVALALGAGLASGVAAWEHQRVSTLRVQIARLVEDESNQLHATPTHPAPIYYASARQFLNERAAQWAPMLRTLESGAMIGVTPTSVEFNATDGVARVELEYTEPAMLFDYLGRINEGVAPGPNLQRWTLLETRAQPGPSGLQPGTTGQHDSVAVIQSNWLDKNASDKSGASDP